MRTISRRELIAGLFTTVVVSACRPDASSSAPEALGPYLSPSALAARLDDVAAGKIAVFYVGPDMLFDRGHVPGARKIGPIDDEAGRRALDAALATVPAETEIVLYCGCCPVRNCPNVRPASAVVRALGRPNAYVLDLPTDFKTDWAGKGHPTSRS